MTCKGRALGAPRGRRVVVGFALRRSHLPQGPTNVLPGRRSTVPGRPTEQNLLRPWIHRGAPPGAATQNGRLVYQYESTGVNSRNPHFGTNPELRRAVRKAARLPAERERCGMAPFRSTLAPGRLRTVTTGANIRARYDRTRSANLPGTYDHSCHRQPPTWAADDVVGHPALSELRRAARPPLCRSRDVPAG